MSGSETAAGARGIPGGEELAEHRPSCATGRPIGGQLRQDVPNVTPPPVESIAFV